MDKIRSVYIDMPFSMNDIVTDDFIVAVGIKQSNSVYHVAASKKVSKQTFNRFYLKCYKSDLMTALKREASQQLISVTWYKR